MSSVAGSRGAHIVPLVARSLGTSSAIAAAWTVAAMRTASWTCSSVKPPSTTTCSWRAGTTRNVRAGGQRVRLEVDLAARGFTSRFMRSRARPVAVAALPIRCRNVVFPEVAYVAAKVARAETSTDPAGLNMTETSCI